MPAPLTRLDFVIASLVENGVASLLAPSLRSARGGESLLLLQRGKCRRQTPRVVTILPRDPARVSKVLSDVLASGFPRVAALRYHAGHADHTGANRYLCPLGPGRHVTRPSDLGLDGGPFPKTSGPQCSDRGV